MHTVTRRIYGTDSEGRPYLKHRPGDIIDDDEAQRVASLVEPKPDVPGWMRLLERRPETVVETPPKSLGEMTVSELRSLCADEDIYPDGSNTRADYIKVICAARGLRQANLTNERQKP